LNAIYQARFMRYLENRGLIEKTPRKIWAFVGDGETDEVDTLGALGVASREKLDNLIFVSIATCSAWMGRCAETSASSTSWKRSFSARAGTSSR
jgi:hypothetical protein